MRLVKYKDLYTDEEIRAALDAQNKKPDDLIEIYTMAETVPEMIRHINTYYKGSIRLAGEEWGFSNQFLNMIKLGDRGVSKKMAPYFNNLRLPAQGEFIRL